MLKCICDQINLITLRFNFLPRSSYFRTGKYAFNATRVNNLRVDLGRTKTGIRTVSVVLNGATFFVLKPARGSAADEKTHKRMGNAVFNRRKVR